MLTKPEFALACVGTGLLFLIGIVLSPTGLARNRSSGMRALTVYAISATIVASIGYGTLAHQAGWSNVWAGISAYDQDTILLREWPPWGTPRSWGYIASGLGVHLLTAVTLISILAPAAVRKHLLLTCTLAELGLVLAVLPWGVLSLARPGLLSSMAFSRAARLQEWIRVIWAPGTLLLTVAIIALGIRWLRAYRRKQAIGRVEWTYAVLAVYSALANARSYLHPIGTFHFHYLGTLFPVLASSMVNLIPQAVEQWCQVSVRQARAQVFLTAILLIYAVAGLAWDVEYLSQLNTELVTPRGMALISTDTDQRPPWVDTLQYIISHTESEDPIVVLGHAPGFYFLSARRNPLRQDTILPGMGSSPADAQEIVRRLETDLPKLMIIPQGVKKGRGWFWDLDIGREAYENLQPVWQYADDHYQVRIVVGGEEWGYAIYEPQDRFP